MELPSEPRPTLPRPRPTDQGPACFGAGRTPLRPSRARRSPPAEGDGTSWRPRPVLASDRSGRHRSRLGFRDSAAALRDRARSARSASARSPRATTPSISTDLDIFATSVAIEGSDGITDCTSSGEWVAQPERAFGHGGERPEVREPISQVPHALSAATGRLEMSSTRLEQQDSRLAVRSR